MNNLITRTLTIYEVKAYDLVGSDDGTPEMQVIAECEIEATSMTKTSARAALAEAVGHSLPKGVTVVWREIGATTYAMPIEDFVNNASVLASGVNKNDR